MVHSPSSHTLNPYALQADAIIQEIHSESLLNLLNSLASETAPFGPTHIGALDNYCCDYGSGAPCSPLKRGDVLEIQGPPASGKTHLIYYLLATCVMPAMHRSVHVLGWERAAIVYDTDNSFDVRRFQRIISQRFQDLVIPEEVPQLVEQCMARLSIVRPTSTLQLTSSIMNVPRFMSKLFPRLELGMIVVDSLSRFYWSDRFAAEGPKDMELEKWLEVGSNRFRDVVASLSQIRASLSPIIVLTNWGLHPMYRHPNQSRYYQQHLSPFHDPFQAEAGQPISVNSSLLPITYHLTTELDETRRCVGYLRGAGCESTGHIRFLVGKEGLSFV